MSYSKLSNVYKNYFETILSVDNLKVDGIRALKVESNPPLKTLDKVTESDYCRDKIL